MSDSRRHRAQSRAQRTSPHESGRQLSQGQEVILKEILKCRQCPWYFVDRYCLIHDATVGSWLPFALWQEQVQCLRTIHAQDLTVILKARQLGFSWLVVCYTLWLMIFRPAATVLLF